MMHATKERIYIYKENGMFIFHLDGEGPHYYPGINKNSIGLWFGFIR